MSEVRLAAEERLLAAYARYDLAWVTGDAAALPAARLELSLALMDCGEELPGPVLSQMDRDRAELGRPVVIQLPAARLAGLPAAR